MNGEFAHFIKTNEMTFKHAKGMRDIVGKEFHTFHEIFIFLGGDAEFISDKLKLSLIPGTLVVIPRETFHQFKSSEDAQYRRCVFNFSQVAELDQLIADKMGHIYTMPLPSELLSHFSELFQAARMYPDSMESKILAKSLLARLLCTLNPFQANHNAPEKIHPLVSNAVSYINTNIRQPLSIPAIAQHLHISESYLMRLFKNDLHISIYRYITEKRLTLAAIDISKGVCPTKAASLAGFGDYSGFYKLYKQHFGVCPSKYNGK